MKDKKKIIIAVVLTIVILAGGIVVGVMIGRNVPVQQEETTTSATTTTTTTTTTAEPSTEPTTESTSAATQTNAPEVSVKVVDKKISDTDKNNFKYAVGEILANGFNEYIPIGDKYEYKLTSYNYKSADAKRYAYSRLLYGVKPVIESYYNIYNYYVHMEKFFDEKDPKGLMTYDYYRIDAEDVDLLLETTFNVKPDHNYILRSDDGEVLSYYHEGKYYVRVNEGETFSTECRINSYKIQDDGKYLIDGTYYSGYYYDDGDDIEKQCDVKVVAEMKNVKGRSFWSVYSIEEK